MLLKLKNKFTRSSLLVLILIISTMVSIVGGCSGKSGGRESQFSKTYSVAEIMNDSVFVFRTGSGRRTHDVHMIIRHSNNYSYGHVPLIIKTTVDDSISTTDTVSLALVDKMDQESRSEEWLGNGFAEYISLRSPYRQNITIKQNAKVEISVKLLMPEKYAKGIYFFGVNVTNAFYPMNTTENDNIN